MRKMIMLFLMCYLIGISQAALTITNGDFEAAPGENADVIDWYDSSDGALWTDAWQSNLDWVTPNGTTVVVFCAWNTDGFEGDPLIGSYIYQSIGNAGGMGDALIQLDFDWGHPDDVAANRHDGMVVSVLASDGTFVPGEETDIYGQPGVELLDYAMFDHVAEGTDGEVFHVSPQLDISGAGDREIFLRFNNYMPVANGDPWPIVDNVEISVLSPIFPYAPLVTPVDSEGKVGNVVKVSEEPVVWEIQDVVLAWKAGQDPNGLYPVNPDIVRHNIYLTTGAPTDPNLYLYDSVTQVSATDPNLSFGPLPNGLLTQSTTYQWQIEQVMDNGSGGYLDGDPNNIFGSVWSFTTASATPAILSGPEHTLTDMDGNATLEITTGLVADGVQWYQVVGEQDTEVNGETDDEMLTDTGIYSGTDTKILTITGAAANGNDDTRVYAIAYNGSTPSEPSPVAWFWYPRLISHYEFASTYAIDSNSFTEDAVSNYDAQLMSNDIGDDVPSLDPNNAPAPGLASTNSLIFDNPNVSDPNNYDTQYAQVNEPWAGAYADITISAWIYWQGGGAWQRVYDFGNDAGQSTFIVPNAFGNSGMLRFAVDTPTSGEQNITAPTGTLPENEWTYICATLSGDTAKLYVNGEWIITGQITLDPVDNGPTTRNWIGRSQYGGDNYFYGFMDDMKVWNYGLTNAEVADDYMSDSEEPYICDMENYDLENYDTNQNCLLDLPDFVSMAMRWLEDDRFYPIP